MKPILIVEDDTATREALGMLLDFEGFPHISAKSFEEAEARIKESEFSVILLDIMLDGKFAGDLIHFTRELRKESSPHIVMLTAISKAEEHAKRLGPDTLIKKPFDPIVLIKLLNIIFHKK